jgi:hypothetical protein
VGELRTLVHGGDGLRSLRTPSMAAKLNAALDADPQFWQGGFGAHGQPAGCPALSLFHFSPQLEQVLFGVGDLGRCKLTPVERVLKVPGFSSLGYVCWI